VPSFIWDTMEEKQIQCPQCSEIFSITGNPGERKTISCPHCHIKGSFLFPDQPVPADQCAISVSNLKKIYGDLVALNRISFSVKKGEVFAFLGPNGAGKTTTVEMIESIRTPTSGTITILGQNIQTDFDSIKEKIGILPQEFHSFDRLTVRETLEYFSKIYKRQADIDEIITAMDLKTKEHTIYKSLSGGLKQRVGVAIALVNDPEIVFLDEPSTGLDPKARREVWQVIAGLRDKGKTVFLTTHYMEEAEYLADHIIIIHKGNIIAEGTLNELIQQYGGPSILTIKNCSHPQIISLLQEKGFTVTNKENGDISIEIAYKDKILEVLSLLRHEAAEFESVDVHRPNLEKIFLNLTGAKLREA